MIKILKTKQVKLRWNISNKEHYLSKGYIFTKYHDLLVVDVYDLLPKSEATVEVVCDYCGKTISKKWSKFLKGRETIEKDACSDCNTDKHRDVYFAKHGVYHHSQTEKSKKYFATIKRKYNIEQVRKMFLKEGYILITDIYINNAQNLYYICPKHGKKHITLNHFLDGKRCNQCQKERIADLQRYTLDDVVNLIHNYDSNIEIFDISYNTYNDNSIKIKCVECGFLFKTTLSMILNGKNRCNHCTNAQSNSEYITETILINNNFLYDSEVSFDGCVYINKLTFDFVVYNKTDNSIYKIIELDGQQHYKPVCFGGDKKIALLEFEKLKIKDQIKNEYCQNNNISLLRIPYWEFDNIENILDEELSKLNKTTRIIAVNKGTAIGL